MLIFLNILIVLFALSSLIGPGIACYYAINECIPLIQKMSQNKTYGLLSFVFTNFSSLINMIIPCISIAISIIMFVALFCVCIAKNDASDKQKSKLRKIFKCLLILLVFNILNVCFGGGTWENFWNTQLLTAVIPTISLTCLGITIIIYNKIKSNHYELY